MPRMQVYLPDDLYRAVKDRGLPASDLLRRAVQAELRRQTLLEETARYVDELVAEVGTPDDAAMAHAEAVADQVRRPGDASRAS
jgi:post-segregation antitoxin (ccd killing protein)